MKKLHCVLITIFLWFGFLKATGRDAIELFSIEGQKTGMQVTLEESVLLTTDRSLYLCGEKIIISAFTYEKNWYKPVALSSVLYVELFNQEKEIISKGKITLADGRGFGFLAVPRDVNSDIYFVRAYTNYMKNFGNKSFTSKRLKIVNPFYESPVDSVTQGNHGDIKCIICPEGGVIIDGIINRVACRFTDTDGEGIKASCRILDMNNDLITRFESYNNGFATFSFKPQHGNRYRIEADINDSILIKELPEDRESGFNISVGNISDESAKIGIVLTDETIPLELIAWHGGTPYRLKDIDIKGSGLYDIPLINLPKGLINIELFNPLDSMSVNRLIYLNPFKKFEISLKTNKEHYQYRDTVNVLVSSSIENTNNGTVLSIYSCLSGEDPDTSEPDLSSAILSQELRKICESDEVLISNVLTDTNLLNIVLQCAPATTEKDITKPRLEYLPEINGDIITGKIIYENNEPASGTEVLQSFTGNASWIESYVTDKSGNFRFMTNNQKNRGDLIIKVKDNQRKCFIIIDNEYYDEIILPKREIFKLSDKEIELINKQFINIQVDDAYSHYNKDLTSEDKMDSIAFYGRDYKELFFPDYIKLPNMKEYLTETFTGISVTRENKQDKITVSGVNSSDAIGPAPLIIIDGIPVTQSSDVLNLNPENVKCIRIVRSKYYYKEQVYDGVIDLITFTADGTAIELPENTIRSGFIHADKEFLYYEPKMMDNSSDYPAVYKNLLFWKSAFVKGKDGEAELTFVTPDNSGKFRIRCFGFTPEGEIGDASIYLTVINVNSILQP